MEDYIISNDNDNDDDLIDDASRIATHSGIYRLWLAVLASAIEVLKNENEDSHHDRGSAKSFLFDKDNIFFTLLPMVSVLTRIICGKRSNGLWIAV